MKAGVDIGGSHIGIGLLNQEGKIIEKIEQDISINNSKEIKSTIENIIVNTINNWTNEKKYEIESIGIGVPGIVKDDIIKYSVNLGISDYDLIKKIKNKISVKNIKIRNDAKSAGLAEKNLGALKPYKDCIFICLGTGIGGAAFYNNQLIVPNRSSGFEFGHMIIERDGDPCRCGSKGCFETYGSMRRLKNDLRSALNLATVIDGEELLNIIKKNIKDENVINVINNYIINLCVGISNIVDILEPQAICIGGSFSYYKDILLKPLKKEFNTSKYVFYKNHIPEIVVAELGNDAGIIGSALYI